MATAILAVIGGALGGLTWQLLQHGRARVVRVTVHAPHELGGEMQLLRPGDSLDVRIHADGTWDTQRRDA